MSFTTTTNKVGPYGVTTLPMTLAVTFPFQRSSDLVVTDVGPYAAPYATSRVLTLNSDYTVTGGGYDSAGNMLTGTIVIVGTGTGAVVLNDGIVIVRSAPENQTTSFHSSGQLTVAMIEQALDKGATLSDQLQNDIQHALRIPSTENGVSALTLAARAGALLGFDPSSNIDLSLKLDAVRTIVIANPIAALSNVLDYGSVGDPVTAVADYGSIA